MSKPKFDKDAWIRQALRTGYLLPTQRGVIFRRNKQGEMREVKPRIHKATGRVYFNMTFAGLTKSVLVNRVVALFFLPNPENKPEVNHIDGDRTNNALDNLEWSTRAENEQHASGHGLKAVRGSSNANAKLTADDVIAIRANPEDIKGHCERLGVARRTIKDVIERRTWTHL